MGHKTLERLRASVVPVLAGLLAVAACGGRVGPADEGVAEPSFAPPAADSERYDLDFGPLMDVSAGEATIGQWSLDFAAHKLQPYPCSATKGFTEKVRVGAFRLMQLEVTNAAYGKCVATGFCAVPDALLDQDLRSSPLPVAGGRWDAPEQRNKPVGLSSDLARAFCLHYGGDLPTPGQWARAGGGESQSYGVEKPTDSFVRCSFREQLPNCDAILSSSFFHPLESPRYRPLPDVGTTPWDQGPFGNLDMFASAAEWLRSGYGFDAPCEVKNDADRARAGGTDLIQVKPATMLSWHLSQANPAPPPQGSDPEPSEPDGPDPYGVVYAYGFRCAFPPPP